MTLLEYFVRGLQLWLIGLALFVPILLVWWFVLWRRTRKKR